MKRYASKVILILNETLLSFELSVIVKKRSSGSKRRHRHTGNNSEREKVSTGCLQTAEYAEMQGWRH